jgi:hypothetical protein
MYCSSCSDSPFPSTKQAFHLYNMIRELNNKKSLASPPLNASILPIDIQNSDAQKKKKKKKKKDDDENDDWKTITLSSFNNKNEDDQFRIFSQVVSARLAKTERLSLKQAQALLRHSVRDVAAAHTTAAVVSSMQTPLKQLEALWQQALAAGLTTEFAMGKMRRSMEEGRFSMEYYLKMWTKRLNKYDSEKVRGVDCNLAQPESVGR